MNLAEVLKTAGVNSASGLSNPPARAYTYTANFDSSLAAGTNAQALTNIERDWVFVVNEIVVCIFLAALTGSAVAGTPVCFDPGDATSGNTMPNLAHFRYFATNSSSGNFSDQPLRCDDLSHAGAQKFLINPWILPAGTNMTMTLHNDSAVAVKAQFKYKGLRVSAKD